MKVFVSLFVVAVMFAAQPAFGALQDNLTAYYGLNNDTSDGSGNGNDGVHTGGTEDYVGGVSGMAIRLDGGTEQIEVAETGAFDYAANSTNAAMSISAWFKVGAFDTNWQALVTKGEGNQFRLHRGGGGQSLNWAAGSAATRGPNVNDGAWHHVFVSHEDGPNGNQMWIDGVDHGTWNGGTLGDNNWNFMIGENAHNNGHNREWEGDIDEVALWGRVLSDEEISTIYAAGLQGQGIGDLIGGNGNGNGVPEPATATLALLGLGGLMMRRRRNA
jgi:hypothetical protein